MKRFKTLLFLCAVACTFTAQAQKKFALTSPDGKLQTTISVGEKLTYDIVCNGKQILSPSPLSMSLDNGKVWGDKAKLQKAIRGKADKMVASPFYRATELRDHYNEITLRFQGNFDVIFRAYDDGIAYRFVSREKTPFHVTNEEVDYRFPIDPIASVPYVTRGKDGDFESQYMNSFENIYTTDRLSKLKTQRLMFLPILIDAGDGVKICITESDLENYPGQYLVAQEGQNALCGHFAPYPKKTEQGGHNRLQMLVKERENYIAQVEQPRTFPWRIAVVSTSDRQLAASNLSYLLASSSRVADLSWVKPGKVAWEWWNAWNLDGVDFKTGVNNATYKAYIDFASKKGIEYVILDEGWAVNLQADLMQVVKDIDLKELVDYASARNVGIILWAGYYAFERDMENICHHYADMGVKGFKVDFMDRDDQQMTAFIYRAAQMAAKYKLVLDFHGMYKPAGLNRTYPNILNFEGVHGLEQVKWIPATTDQVTYDVMIPFIRQVAGPLDYTQGAMRNASKSNYRPCNSEPMSQGTRCRQLALYMIFDSPLNMMCDTPSNYLREPESTDFIAAIPTVWDETLILSGEVGEYIVTARRKGADWYIGGITNWTERDIELDCSFLTGETYGTILFKDGVNANRVARDYKCEHLQIGKSDKVKIHLASGGGFAMKLQAQ